MFANAHHAVYTRALIRADHEALIVERAQVARENWLEAQARLEETDRLSLQRGLANGLVLGIMCWMAIILVAGFSGC